MKEMKVRLVTPEPGGSPERSSYLWQESVFGRRCWLLKGRLIAPVSRRFGGSQREMSSPRPLVDKQNKTSPLVVLRPCKHLEKVSMLANTAACPLQMTPTLS